MRTLIGTILLVFVFSCSTLPQRVDRYANKLNELRADKTIVESQSSGWSTFTFEEEESLVMWVFTPEKHFAHPSFAERKVIRNSDGSWAMRTNLTCGASSEACERNLLEYNRLDKKMKLGLPKRQWI